MRREELPLGRVGDDEQLPDFGRIGIGRQLLINRIRRIEAHLPPVGDAPGPFASAVEGMIGDEAAGEIRLLATDEGVVVMQLKRPLSNFRDLGVVDLDLVNGMRRDRSSDEQDCGKRDASSETSDHCDAHQHARRAHMLPLKCRRMVAPRQHTIGLLAVMRTERLRRHHEAFVVVATRSLKRRLNCCVGKVAMGPKRGDTACRRLELQPS